MWTQGGLVCVLLRDGLEPSKQDSAKQGVQRVTGYWFSLKRNGKQEAWQNGAHSPWASHWWILRDFSTQGAHLENNPFSLLHHNFKNNDPDALGGHIAKYTLGLSRVSSHSFPNLSLYLDSLENFRKL